MHHAYANQLDLAQQAVRRRFKPFLDAAVSKEDKVARQKMIHQDVVAAVTKFTPPLPSTMGRIKAALRVAEWQSPLSDWSFDNDFNGWVAKAGCTQSFLCDDCGRSLSKLGFQHCACGKSWNGYEIKDENKEASTTLTVWRSIAERPNTKVAATEDADLLVGEDLAELQADAAEPSFSDPTEASVRVAEDALTDDAYVEDVYYPELDPSLAVPDENLTDDQWLAVISATEDDEDDYKRAFVSGYKAASKGLDIDMRASDGFLAGFEAWANE